MTLRMPVVFDNTTPQIEVLQSGDAIDLGNANAGSIKTLGWYQEYANGSSGDSYTIDWTKGNFQSLMVTDNCVLNICTTSGFPKIGRYQLRLVQTDSSAYSIQWLDSGTGVFSASNWINNATTPQINQNANGETIIIFVWNGTILFQSIEYVNTNVGIAIQAGSQIASGSISPSGLVFANSNGISFGMSGSSQITASGNSVSFIMGRSNIGSNDLGTSGVVSSSGIQLVLQGGSNISLSQSLYGLSGTDTLNFGNMQMGISALTYPVGNVLGTTGMIPGQYLFVGGNNVSLSQSSGASSATVTINAAVDSVINVPIQAWEPFPFIAASTTNVYTLASASIPVFMPFVLPVNLSISNIMFPLSLISATSNDTGSIGASWDYAIYTRVPASTTQIGTLCSSQYTWSASYSSTNRFLWAFGGTSSSGNSGIATQINGMRLIALPFVTSLSAGEYWFAFNFVNAAGTGSTNAIVQRPYGQFVGTVFNNVGLIGAVSSNTIMPSYGWGSYSTQAGMPATVGFNQVIAATGLHYYVRFENNAIS